MQKHMTRKATRHVNQNEGLIFEKSSPGKAAWKLPPLDVPDVDPSKLLGSAERKDLGQMPEVSEIEIIRPDDQNGGCTAAGTTDRKAGLRVRGYGCESVLTLNGS